MVPPSHNEGASSSATTLKQRILDSLCVYHDRGAGRDVAYLRFVPIETSAFPHGLSLNVAAASENMERAKGIVAEYLVSCFEAVHKERPVAESPTQRRADISMLAEDNTIEVPSFVCEALALKSGQYIYFVKDATGRYYLCSESQMDAALAGDSSEERTANPRDVEITRLKTDLADCEGALRTANRLHAAACDQLSDARRQILLTPDADAAEQRAQDLMVTVAALQTAVAQSNARSDRAMAECERLRVALDVALGGQED